MFGINYENVLDVFFIIFLMFLLIFIVICFILASISSSLKSLDSKYKGSDETSICFKSGSDRSQ